MSIGDRRPWEATDGIDSNPSFILTFYCCYRPRMGDNTFDSVLVCPSVCLWALSCLNRLTFDLDFWPWLVFFFS